MDELLPSQPTTPEIPPFNIKFEEMNSVFLRDNYLFGVPLQDMYGNKMTEKMLQHYINSAIQHAQRVFQITIQPTVIEDEIHDYYANDYQSWGFIQLHKRPIVEVQSLTMKFGDTRMFDIPKDWIRSYSLSGQLQLFPTQGSAGGIILSQGGAYLPWISGGWRNAPQMWRVTYKVGMDYIPEDLVEYIMKRASIGILQVWGDLIIGAGIANQTISIDGLSQSIGTTQSPEFSGAGARIKNYSDDIKELEKRLKDTYLGINLGLL